ncbi:MAG TPA: hypothetical protein IAC04_01235 [Candidatus Coprenecus stercoravium]|uniref:YD repeat-containing protein n=1 Tax=Candidatus Coprenecus stercoravium TaxID=2840735 RepID=A0A9D2KAA8_9BACT|nr:hypothetical protein [Candidatus Coprenecus stercoravium]
MRKYFHLAIFAAALLPVSCTSSWTPAVEPDFLKYELSGPVASMRTVPYTVDSVSGEMSGIDITAENTYVEFDRDGRITLQRYYNSKNEHVADMRHIYDADGHMTGSVRTSALGSVLESSVRRYSGDRLMSERFTGEDDSLKKYEEYRYYAPDSVVMEFSFKEGKPAGQRVMEYDSVGRVISSVTRAGGGVMSDMTFAYDSVGHRILVASNSVFMGELSVSSEYDDMGFCVSSEIDGQRGKMRLRFEHELDSLGNWTVRRTYRDSSPTPVRIELRTLTYYAD